MKRNALISLIFCLLAAGSSPLSSIAAQGTPETEAETAFCAEAAEGYAALYCSTSAKEEIEEEELERIMDLIINHTSPLAVNLLLEKLPVFREAADRGAITGEIGLYVFYDTGDRDTFSHYVYPDVKGAAIPMFMMDDDDGTLALGNIIHINLKHFLERDEEGRLYADISSPGWTSLEHTLVHEFTHAFMTDYNRAGMLGDNSPEYSFYNGDQNFMNLHMDYYDLLIFPSWFVEGTASRSEECLWR